MKHNLTAFFLILFISATAFTAEPVVWSVDSRAEVLRGDARGVSIAENGTLTLAPVFRQVYRTEQPYIWSAVADAQGNVYLGTGSDGRIFRVRPDGTGSLFADLAELNVSAMAIGQGGELYAAGSPDGKVYRIDAAGKPEVYFDPGTKYIWALAPMPDGSLVVATGDSGKLFRVRKANAAPNDSVMYDSSESHIISLAADKQGNLYAGTDPGGLVLRFGPDGKPFGLLDSPLREIHELAVGIDGSVYALAIGESVSAATPAPSPSPETRTVTADRQPAAAAPPAPPKSKYDLTGVRSAVYRIQGDGLSDLIWSSQSVTGFALFAPQGGGVLIGTSDKGRIYSVTNDGRETLVVQSDAGQISAFAGRGDSLFAASSNQGVLYKLGPETLAEGTYESAVLDARSAALWGRAWWRSAGNVVIETRSGNSESPNEMWSAWQPVSGEPAGGKVLSPRARFIQFRALLRSGSVQAALNELSLAYQARNLPPDVLAIAMLPINVGLVPNPPPQVDPNIELSGMDPAIFGIPSQAVPPRRVFQRGARAFQWLAEDRNDDKLVFDVFYRDVTGGDFRLLRQDLSENFISLDTATLPDGRYVLRVVAKDTPSNPGGTSLTGERVSEPFDVDNSAPAVAAAAGPSVSGNRAVVTFAASEKGTRITRAEYSINGGEWMAAAAEDGVADGTEERFVIDAQLPRPGDYTISIRVFDAAGNAGGARVSVKR